MPDGDENQPQQIHYVYALREIDDGWTDEQKLQLANWFSKAVGWRGGASFPGFISLLFEESLDVFDDAERQMAYEAVPALAPLSDEELAAALRGARGGREAAAVRPGNARVRGVAGTSPQEIFEYQLFVPLRNPADPAEGRAVFAQQCAACHRFGDLGNDFAQDLTTVGSRFQKRDILEAILWPSDTISDQYAATLVTTAEGELNALVVGEDDTTLTVNIAQNPRRMLTIQKTDITARAPSTVSLMPEGLVDDLGQQDIADLIAFLQAGSEP